MSKLILSDRITYPPPVSIRQPSDLQECQKNAQNRAVRGFRDTGNSPLLGDLRGLVAQVRKVGFRGFGGYALSVLAVFLLPVLVIANRASLWHFHGLGFGCFHGLGL